MTRSTTTRRHHLATLAGLASGALLLAASPALAEDTVKIGVILPMTGPSASTEIDRGGCVPHPSPMRDASATKGRTALDPFRRALL